MNTPMPRRRFLFFGIGVLCYLSEFLSAATDTLSSVQTLEDGGSSSLVSSGGSFELGFFSPGTSQNRYLGVWYKNIPVRTYVWVANRDSPINDTSGAVMVDKATGNLVILSHNGTVVVWSSNSSRTAAGNNPAVVVQLMETGNLVLRDENQSNLYLWQSFDYPTDTVLPGMKIGWDTRTGINRRLAAWKSPNDPSSGELSMALEHPYPERIVRLGSLEYTRSGPWNGLGYSGVPELKSNNVYVVDIVSNEYEAYYIYYMTSNSSVTSRLVLDETGLLLIRSVWNVDESSWQALRSFPIDLCDHYAKCGPYGICAINETPMCYCLQGFQPKSPANWASMDWSDGCVRTNALNCSITEGFKKFTGLKLPDTTYTWLNQSMTLNECEAKCLSNCSCTAYSNSDIRGKGSGCAIWFNDLLDIRQLAPGGQDLHIRMPYSDLAGHQHNIKILSVSIVAVVVSIVGAMLMIGCCIQARKWRPKVNTMNNVCSMEEEELPLFKKAEIVKATDNFSAGNKLGEGGFGPVYKGVLEGGKEIAVKRLSRSSLQGEDEFKNELVLVAQLQHRNLVKLLGCCLEGGEKLLVYEYMPNRSLDHFLFDHSRDNLLDWPKRFGIICGIARGLLYLHRDARLRIIHRDLKPGNILLDDKMNAKISDFGGSKIFGGDQIEGITGKIVGTLGYMAPEYFEGGTYSIKSDVFSFGVLLLEIVSGKKNVGPYGRGHRLNLIKQAWVLWQEGRFLDLIDESLFGSYDAKEAERCIHVGLLSVQQLPEDRPSMSRVVFMLESESHDSPQPKQPAFFTSPIPLEASDPCSSSRYSTNEVTITVLESR